MVALSACASLRRLDCSSTKVSALDPLAGLMALERLNCVETPVASLAPLAGLTGLQSLTCRHYPSRGSYAGDLALLSVTLTELRINCFF